MSRNKTALGFAAGLLIGLSVAVAWFGARGVIRAAQEVERTPAYQISAWAHPAASNNVTVVDRARHGAYVIDTRSGKVWLIEGGAEPRPIGQVK